MSGPVPAPRAAGANAHGVRAAWSVAARRGGGGGRGVGGVWPARPPSMRCALAQCPGRRGDTGLPPEVCSEAGVRGLGSPSGGALGRAETHPSEDSLEASRGTWGDRLGTFLSLVDREPWRSADESDQAPGPRFPPTSQKPAEADVSGVAGPGMARPGVGTNRTSPRSMFIAGEPRVHLAEKLRRCKGPGMGGNEASSRGACRSQLTPLPVETQLDRRALLKTTDGGLTPGPGDVNCCNETGPRAPRKEEGALRSCVLRAKPASSLRSAVATPGPRRRPILQAGGRAQAEHARLRPEAPVCERGPLAVAPFRGAEADSRRVLVWTPAL